MNYVYFELTKSSKQFRTLKLGEYNIEFRIEWNVRSKSWFILGYIENDLVLSNTKFEINRLYSFDKNIKQYLPYNISILAKFDDNDWDTPTMVILTDDYYSDSDRGLTRNNVLIDRFITTSNFTHNKSIAGSTRNSYLFDIVNEESGEDVVITCDDATSSFASIGLPQGRWLFTINGTEYNVAIQENEYDDLYELLLAYGISITTGMNGQKVWKNTSDDSVRIHAVYPYESGYEFDLIDSSNPSLNVINRDQNNWVNEFSVCLNPEDNSFSAPYDLTVEFKND